MEEWKAICAAAGGDSLAAREKCGNIVLVLSCNESNGTKQWAPDHSTEEGSKLAKILNQFPQGTVSIIWGGDAVGELWFLGEPDKIKNFSNVSNQYFVKLLHGNHPIYDPSELYATLEMNKRKSSVKGLRYEVDKDVKRVEWIGHVSWKQERGFHFFSCESSNEKLITMVTAAA